MLLEIMFAYNLHKYWETRTERNPFWRDIKYWKDPNEYIISIRTFMDTLEFTLNNAIDACGAAIHYVKLFAGSFTCKECYSNEFLKKVFRQVLTKNIFPYSWMIMISQLGGWAAAIAALITMAEKELVKNIIT
jgi:hypothetical protein